MVVALGATAALLAWSAPAHGAVVSEVPDSTPTFNGTVWAIAYAGNTVYVGGDFTAAAVGGRSHARSRLAAFDANTGALLSWAPSADGRVRAIAAGAGAVYVAGEFRTVNGTARDSLARLDASTGALHAAFKHTIYGQPHSAAVGSGRLYLAGTITSVDGRARSRLAAFDLSTGALDAGWAPVADDRVEGVVATADRIYLAGKFHTINGVSGSARLAAVSPSSGAVDLSFRPRASVIAHSMAIGPNRVYAAHGGQGGRVVAYDLAGRTAWTLTMDGDPQAVAVLDGVLYIGGHFDNVCRSTRTGDRGVCLDGSVRRVKLAAATLDGALAAWTANGNGIDGVHALAASPALSRVAAGGSFTTINGVTHPRFAQFRR